MRSARSGEISVLIASFLSFSFLFFGFLFVFFLFFLFLDTDSIVGNNMLYRTDEKGPEVELLRNIDKLHRTAAYVTPSSPPLPLSLLFFPPPTIALTVNRYLFPSAQGKENPDTKTTRATGNNNNKNKNINRNNNNNNNITSSHNSFISTPSSSNPSTSNNNNNINTTSKRKALDEPGEHLLADVFWATWEKLNYQLPRSHTMYVLLFYLTSPSPPLTLPSSSSTFLLFSFLIELMLNVQGIHVRVVSPGM